MEALRVTTKKPRFDTTSSENPFLNVQIGDETGRLDVVLENANKIIEEKVGAKLDVNTSDGVTEAAHEKRTKTRCA